MVEPNGLDPPKDKYCRVSVREGKLVLKLRMVHEMCLSDCEQDVMDAKWEEGIYGMRIDIEWERDEGGTKAKGLHVVGGSRLIYPVTNFSGPLLTLASNSAFIIWEESCVFCSRVFLCFYHFSLMDIFCFCPG